jgi:hypothetical protein
MKRQIRKMTTAGPTTAATKRSVVETFSLWTNGKLMLRSTGEKGRLFGVILEKSPPATAVALDDTISLLTQNRNMNQDLPLTIR